MNMQYLPGRRRHGSYDTKGIAVGFEYADDFRQSLYGFLVAAGAVHEDDGIAGYSRILYLRGNVVDKILGYRMIGRGIS